MGESADPFFLRAESWRPGASSQQHIWLPRPDSRE